MREHRFVGTVVAVGLLGLCGAESRANVAGVEWDELTKAIRAIESATTVDDALAAYAKGCTQNRRSAKLQEAQLRRMLKFGRPDLAVPAAKELSTIAPRNGLAWGLLAYTHAKNERYLAAFPLSLKALDLEPKNPGICQNAAQLLVWYEGGKRKAVDADTSSLMRKYKSAGRAARAFGKALKTAKTAYAKLDREIQAKKKEADNAVKEAEKLEKKHEQLRQKLRSMGRSFDSEEQRVQNAKREIVRAEDAMNRSRDYNTRVSAERQRESAVRNLQVARRAARRHLSEGKKIKKDMLDAQKEHKSKKEHSARLLRKANEIGDGVPGAFGWLPPAIDGVVTPDASVAVAKPRPGTNPKGKPGASYLAPTKAKPKGTPGAPNLSEQLAEAEAADKLGLAKLCMGSKDAKMKAAAKKLLGEILTKYPKTKAAAEARQLATKLP